MLGKSSRLAVAVDLHRGASGLQKAYSAATNCGLVEGENRKNAQQHLKTKCFWIYTKMYLAPKCLDGMPEFAFKVAPKRGLAGGFEENSEPCVCRWFREMVLRNHGFKETLYTQKRFQKFLCFWPRPIDSGWRGATDADGLMLS